MFRRLSPRDPVAMFHEIWVVCDEGSRPEAAVRIAAEMARRRAGRTSS